MPPPVLYARRGDVSIAYQVVGDRGVDILMTPGWTSHLMVEWEEPRFVRFMDRLTRFARLIRFDKRGTGLSDRPPGVATLEHRMEDAHAVLDAVGLDRVAVWGWSEGGPMSALLSATYPQRVTHLVLYGTRAAFGPAADYPWASETREDELRELEQNWGRNRPEWIALDTDERFLDWAMRWQQAGASPSAAVALARANAQIDCRGFLSAVKVPTLVINRSDDPVGPADAGRDLAERIHGSRFVELPGRTHMMWGGDIEPLASEVEAFLTGEKSTGDRDRFLTSILIADVAGTTQQVVSLGDARWRDLIAQTKVVTRRQVEAFGGHETDFVGDQVMALFDGPVRAIRCAHAVQREAAHLGVAFRAGIHTGEVERAEQGVRGVAVHVAARVAAQAGPGELLVTGTVREITAGSGINFAQLGRRRLKGIPDQVRLYRVEP